MRQSTKHCLRSYNPLERGSNIEMECASVVLSAHLQSTPNADTLYGTYTPRIAIHTLCIGSCADIIIIMFVVHHSNRADSLSHGKRTWECSEWLCLVSKRDRWPGQGRELSNKKTQVHARRVRWGESAAQIWLITAATKCGRTKRLAAETPVCTRNSMSTHWHHTGRCLDTRTSCVLRQQWHVWKTRSVVKAPRGRSSGEYVVQLQHAVKPQKWHPPPPVKYRTHRYKGYLVPPHTTSQALLWPR